MISQRLFIFTCLSTLAAPSLHSASPEADSNSPIVQAVPVASSISSPTITQVTPKPPTTPRRPPRTPKKPIKKSMLSKLRAKLQAARESLRSRALKKLRLSTSFTEAIKRKKAQQASSKKTRETALSPQQKASLRATLPQAQFVKKFTPTPPTTPKKVASPAPTTQDTPQPAEKVAPKPPTTPPPTSALRASILLTSPKASAFGSMTDRPEKKTAEGSAETAPSQTLIKKPAPPSGPAPEKNKKKPGDPVGIPVELTAKPAATVDLSVQAPVDGVGRRESLSAKEEEEPNITGPKLSRYEKEKAAFALKAKAAHTRGSRWGVDLKAIPSVQDNALSIDDKLKTRLKAIRARKLVGATPEDIKIEGTNISTKQVPTEDGKIRNILQAKPTVQTAPKAPENPREELTQATLAKLTKQEKAALVDPRTNTEIFGLSDKEKATLEKTKEEALAKLTPEEQLHMQNLSHEEKAASFKKLTHKREAAASKLLTRHITAYGSSAASPASLSTARSARSAIKTPKKTPLTETHHRTGKP